MAETFNYEGWVVLELYGHRRLGGYLTIAQMGNGQLLRIDVHQHCEKEYTTQPGPDLCLSGKRLCVEHQEEAPHDRVVATQFYGTGAVYCLTPVNEEAARAVARTNVPQPIHQWELSRPKLEHRNTDQSEFEELDDDDERT